MEILIVEDDKVLSLLLQKMIWEMGYTVTDSVSKGTEAVEKALSANVDLILMDIMLEDEVDGIEAYRRIKEKKEIPVIYITGNSDQMNKERAGAIGYHDFMAKPVIFDELQDSIEKLIIGDENF
jgi:CheY-like chemotaxis protein